MHRRLLCPSLLLASATMLAACSGAKKGSGFGASEADGGLEGGDSVNALDSGSLLSDDASDAPAGCYPDPNNFEIPGNGCDDDGDGKVDDVQSCDTGLSINGDAAEFARAIGLCQTASGADDTKWGVISVAYVDGYGSTRPAPSGQHGILPRFGNVVAAREGSVLGVLSSGYAREYNSLSGLKTPFKFGQPLQASPTVGPPPPGFPKPSSTGCPVVSEVYDFINVKIEIKVPNNAKGLQFDFDFWSSEWPEYVCSDYNDAFIAYLHAKGFNSGAADNMSFDSQTNPVSVNNGFFDRCTPNTEVGCEGSQTSISACPGGVAELAGTGFDFPDVYCGSNSSSGGGATGWLTSTAPVEPGEVITLEFMLWDTGDSSFDSSVLLDNFQWVPSEVTTGTARPPK